MSVLAKAVVVLLVASPAIAQSPAFEEISIKPVRSGDPVLCGSRPASLPALAFSGCPLPTMKLWQLSGVPVSRMQ
jgi:hypothetical protein